MRCSDRPMLSVTTSAFPVLTLAICSVAGLPCPPEDEQHQLIGIDPGVIAHGIDVSEDQLR